LLIWDKLFLHACASVTKRWYRPRASDALWLER